MMVCALRGSHRVHVRNGSSVERVGVSLGSIALEGHLRDHRIDPGGTGRGRRRVRVGGFADDVVLVPVVVRERSGGGFIRAEAD